MNISIGFAALVSHSSSKLEHASEQTLQNKLTVNNVESEVSNAVTHISSTFSASKENISTYDRPLVNQDDGQSPNSISNESTENKATSSQEESESNQTSPATENDLSEAIYTEDELQIIESLKLRDLEVIAHERAHATVGGQHTGAPSYNFETGPDGVKYAVSGEVSIDTSPVPGDPQATLQKAQQIKAAALAPTEPSSQDMKVARKAEEMASVARSELLKENDANLNNTNSNEKNNNVTISNESLKIATDQISSDKNEKEMYLRNVQINSLYQNSTNTASVPSLDLEV